MNTPERWTERYNQLLLEARRGRVQSAIDGLGQLVEDILGSRDVADDRVEEVWLTAWLTRAELWLQTGRKDLAKAAVTPLLETFEERDPEQTTDAIRDRWSRALCLSAEMLAQEGREEEALSRLDVAVDLAERVRHGDYASAALRSLLDALAARARVAERLRSPDRAERDLERVFHLADSPDAKGLLPEIERFALLGLYGRVLLRLGAVSRAAERFEAAAKLGHEVGLRVGREHVQAGIAAAFLGRARAEAAMGLRDRALDGFTLAEAAYARLEGVRLDPPLPRSLAEVAFEKGRFLASCGRADDALVALQRAREYLAMPRTREDHDLAGTIHAMLGQVLEGMEHCEEAQVEFEMSLREYGRAMEGAGPDEAARTVLAHAHFGLALTLRKQQRWEEALSEVREILALLEPIARPAAARHSSVDREVAERILHARMLGAVVARRVPRRGEAEAFATAARELAHTLVVDQRLISLRGHLEAAASLVELIRRENQGDGRSAA